MYSDNWVYLDPPPTDCDCGPTPLPPTYKPPKFENIPGASISFTYLAANPLTASVTDPNPLNVQVVITATGGSLILPNGTAVQSWTSTVGTAQAVTTQMQAIKYMPQATSGCALSFYAINAAGLHTTITSSSFRLDYGELNVSALRVDPQVIVEGQNAIFTVGLSHSGGGLTAQSFAFTGTAAQGSDWTMTLTNGVTIDGGKFNVPSNVSSFKINVTTYKDFNSSSAKNLTLTIGTRVATLQILDVSIPLQPITLAVNTPTLKWGMDPIRIEATAVGSDLPNHTFLWSQLEGDAVTWVEGPNSRVSLYTNIPGKQKFRLTADDGTLLVQHIDLEMRDYVEDKVRWAPKALLSLESIVAKEDRVGIEATDVAMYQPTVLLSLSTKSASVSDEAYTFTDTLFWQPTTIIEFGITQ